MFGSTGQKRYDLRNRTTPADDWESGLAEAPPRNAEDGPARKMKLCGARHVSVPLDTGTKVRKDNV
ncbi:hypothetical protein MNJPNG_12855 [Cupriavidus oxalaticus]